MFILNFFYGLVLIIVGILGLKFNFQVTNSFSRNNIFEQKLGPGSTYLVFQVLAVGIILFGTMMMFSLHDNLLNFLFAPLKNIFQLNN